MENELDGSSSNASAEAGKGKRAMAERLDDVDPLAGLQDVEFDGDSGVVSSKGSGLNGTKIREIWEYFRRRFSGVVKAPFRGGVL